jgi:hypothetical protein
VLTESQTADFSKRKFFLYRLVHCLLRDSCRVCEEQPVINLYKILVYELLLFLHFMTNLRVEVGVAASTAINAAVHRKSGSEVMVQV